MEAIAIRECCFCLRFEACYESLKGHEVKEL